ncbi:hypothetical protein EOD39_10144 [Acipenser ruthenus]|uniref:Uncharacterized protein n=1 Tax=Acipenser ruthenus TaxID=7906 RepID=A0A662YX74_ACIRT|nr:hypothetical protein EOD39_10144 [Acipenser ruthenus]
MLKPPRDVSGRGGLIGHGGAGPGPSQKHMTEASAMEPTSVATSSAPPPAALSPHHTNCNQYAGLHDFTGCSRNSRCGGSSVAAEQGGLVSEPAGPAMGATEGVGHFCCESGGLWAHRIIQHSISTGDTAPIRELPRRLPLAKQETA